jgi:hypothetical protein
MLTGKTAAILVAGVLLAGTTGHSALAQMAPEGTVYSAHTPKLGGCPALDWHLAVGPNHTLDGMVGVQGMQEIWRVSGSSTPDRHFHLTGQEMGGQQRTGTVDGEVLPNGTLELTMGNITGPSNPCNNKSVYIRWFRNGNAYSRNGTAGGGG